MTHAARGGLAVSGLRACSFPNSPVLPSLPRVVGVPRDCGAECVHVFCQASQLLFILRKGPDLYGN